MKKMYIYLIAILVFALDEITKFIVISNISNTSNIVIIKNFFSITYVENTGGAWGIFSNNTLFLIIFSVIIFGLFVFFIQKNNINKNYGICFGFVIGGMLGNLFDRIFRHFVVDFLNFYILGYDFPVFNVADIFIVIGGILFMILSLIDDRKNKVKEDL